MRAKPGRQAFGDDGSEPVQMPFTEAEQKAMSEVRAAWGEPDMASTEAFLRLYEQRDAMSIAARRTRLDLEGRVALLEMENAYLRRLVTTVLNEQAMKALNPIVIADPAVIE
jgi:hypothetical protein